MEDLYGFHYAAGYSEQSQSSLLAAPPLTPTGQNIVSPGWTSVPEPPQLVRSGSSSSDAVSSVVVGVEDDEASRTLRAKIASHPLFPKLLDAYINCQKVGASENTVKLLEEIGDQNSHGDVCQTSALWGADPELDDFMETYCSLLVKYKSDISRPFDEAVTFVNDMETQLNSICNINSAVGNITEEPTGSSEEDFGREEKEAMECKVNEDRELKDMLLRRYSGYISRLKHEFSKNKKKEKIPKEVRQTLIAWWNIHFNWPYPTETDKIALAEWTGLDQKQINNWFINQRKRHWKPSAEMKFQLKAQCLDDRCMSISDNYRDFIYHPGCICLLEKNGMGWKKNRRLCIEGPESLLVYEYVPDKSLDQILFGKNSSANALTWEQRFQIICGIAEGLSYLHGGSGTKIIHRDIKSSNILVDGNLNPKIAEFRLSICVAENKSHLSTADAWTLGYMAPEYLKKGQITEKADVYAFGVLVIEIVCGKKNNDYIPGSNSLLHSVWKNYKANNITESVDPALHGKFKVEEASNALQAGLLCTQSSVTLRPSMSEVVQMLTKKDSVIPSPKQQPFLNSNVLNPGDRTLTSSLSGLSSNGHATPRSSFHSTTSSPIPIEDLTV
ncbi:hypothetical protein VNO77_24701 [Canavalia gladiata]|uniref:Protein kinase domain-containing protein n=1 Tax=Canavalia gladiata TaxID=3824 RepID=A0AAN9L874_CANGL